MNVVHDAEALEILLNELQREHRALDAQITELQQAVAVDRLAIGRLKKQKLRLKDQITRISEQLYPDIIA